MSLSQSLSGLDGLKSRLMTLGLTGNLWFEFVVNLNLRFVFCTNSHFLHQSHHPRFTALKSLFNKLLMDLEISVVPAAIVKYTPNDSLNPTAFDLSGAQRALYPVVKSASRNC
jgi:hypothetical protein